MGTLEIRENQRNIKGCTFKTKQYPVNKVWPEPYERLLNVEFEWVWTSIWWTPLEGPPIPMTIDRVKKVVSKLKFGKAAGPSGIVVEMVRAAGDTGANMICNLAIAIIWDGKVPADWEQSFISSAFTREKVICSGPMQL